MQPREHDDLCAHLYSVERQDDIRLDLNRDLNAPFVTLTWRIGAVHDA
jgi:hypothetical protein